MSNSQNLFSSINVNPFEDVPAETVNEVLRKLHLKDIMFLWSTGKSVRALLNNNVYLQTRLGGITLDEFIKIYNNLRAKIAVNVANSEDELVLRKEKYLADVFDEKYTIKAAAILFLSDIERAEILLFKNLRHRRPSREVCVSFVASDALTIALVEERPSANELLTMLGKRSSIECYTFLFPLFCTTVGLKAYQQGLMGVDEAVSLDPAVLTSWMQQDDESCDVDETLEDLRKRQQLLANPQHLVTQGVATEEDVRERFNSLNYRYAALVLDGFSLATAELIKSEEEAASRHFQYRPYHGLFSRISLDFVNSLKCIYSLRSLNVIPLLNNERLAALLIENKINLEDLFTIHAILLSKKINKNTKTMYENLLFFASDRAGCKILIAGSLSFAGLYDMLATRDGNLKLFTTLMSDGYLLLRRLHAYITDETCFAQSGVQTVREFQQRVKALPLPCLQAVVSNMVTFKDGERAAEQYWRLNEIERFILEKLNFKKSIKILLSLNPAHALVAMQLKKISTEVKALPECEKLAQPTAELGV